MTAKRFVKLCMALGYDRNYSNDLRSLVLLRNQRPAFLRYLFWDTYADLYAYAKAEVERGGVKNG